MAYHLTQDEIVRRGQEIYDRDLRSTMEPGQRGKIVAIDVETGDYEIAADVLHAVRALRQRHPDAVPYILRAGYPAVYTLGAHFKVSPA